MTLQDFVSGVVYPALGMVITALGYFAVSYLRAMAATKAAEADRVQLAAVLERGRLLAVAKGATQAQIPAAVASYLNSTSPELAVRTGMSAGSNGAPTTTEAGATRIDASIAAPTPLVVVPPPGSTTTVTTPEARPLQESHL